MSGNDVTTILPMPTTRATTEADVVEVDQPIRLQPLVEVLILQSDQSWSPGLMNSWRWTDKATGSWEGNVGTPGTMFHWVPGSDLRRVGLGQSPEPPIRP